MELMCSLGLDCCNSIVDYTKNVGSLISWQEALSIGGIIFAASQFMEAVKIRNYIYRFGWIYSAIPILVGTSTLAVIIANLIQITNTNTPLLSYPAFYELIALSALSILLLLFVLFFLRPQTFLSFNNQLLGKLRRELVYNQTDENMTALSRIIDNYLEQIVKSASRAKRRMYRNELEKNKESDNRSLDFIDIDMSTPNFVKYIAVNNIGFILHFIDLVNKYKLWEAGGGIFVDRLTESLFSAEDSLLSRELMFGGVSGIQKPITNKLFRSNGLLSHYRVLNVGGFWSSEVSIITLNNWTHALEVALKHYFAEERNIHYMDTPNVALSYSLERLGESTRSIIHKIYKLEDAELWDSEYGSKLSIIGGFFERLQNILVVTDPNSEYKPVISEQELKIEDRTVTEGLAKGLFAYLEAFALMNGEEYSRMHAIQPFWLIFDGHSYPVLNGIRLKVLGLIKERIEDNFKDRYASMIKLMLYIYDGSLISESRSDNEIMAYMCDIFRKDIASKLINDSIFRSKHMPKHWFISQNGKEIYRKMHGRDELLFPITNYKI